MSAAFTEATGRRVVASDTAEEVGEVKTFIVDTSGHSISQIQVGGRKRKPQLIDWAEIDAFGTDAVMISSADKLHEAPDERTDEMVRGTVEYMGSRVLTTDGENVGTVTDVHFDEATGDVLAVMSDNGRLDAALVQSLGSYAVVVVPPS